MPNDPTPISTPLQVLMARIEAKRGKSVEEHAKDVAAEVHAEIAPAGKLPPEQGWMSFAPMPTDMCRVSPFFPMNPRQMEKREYIDGMVIASNAWGDVKYSGPKLSTFEEDVLLAVLALLKAVEPTGEDEPAWTYDGALRPILVAMGIKRTGGDNYRRVRDALRRLAGAVVEIRTKRGRWTMSSMISWAGGDEKSNDLTVTVNPYFAEMYAAGSVNLLDLAKRAELSRPVSKALHRFATSHRGDWRGHFLTLAAAINLDMDQPPKQLRRLIRQGMTELRKVGVLTTKSKFAGDVVTLAVVQGSRKEVASA